ncbi:MAG: Uma2 family endonuclease [SAR324 cluster bacterium]|nr:Uma2 family endonuclease [SAR324 cluster bacterium]
MLAPQPQHVVYPESDGKPMAETDLHRQLIIKAIDILQKAFPNAYVSGNICLYYEQGNPRKMISPDVLLCCSQEPDVKRTYLAWEENAQLDLVIEFSSFSTRREDHHKKKRIYEQILKVPYYVIFDPHGIYLNVWQLNHGEYAPLEPDEQGYYHLFHLNLHLAIEENNSLRFFNSEKTPLLTVGEWGIQLAEQESKRAEQESKRAEQESKRAEQESKRAEQESKRAEQERKEKELALAEQKRLQNLLKAAGIDPSSA